MNTICSISVSYTHLDVYKRQDIFPAVACDMVVYAKLQSLKERGFPMIAAAYDQGDSFPDAHAGNRPMMGQIQCDFHGRGGGEGNAFFHGAVRYPGLPGKDGTIGYKRTQIQGRQLGADIMLVLSQMRCV